MTRIPVPWEVDYSPEAQAASARFYPLAGLVIGAVAALVYGGASLLWSQPIAAVLGWAASVVVTGGLHEDGLADTADGLGGAADRTRALEIMRDSSVGVFGVLALLVSAALQVTVLASVSVGAGLALLCLGHGISRYAPVYAIRHQTYARASGAKFATPEIDAAGDQFAAICAAAMGAALLLLVGWTALAGLALAAGFAALLMRRYLARLDGYTGDCLGALQQLSLLGLFLGVALWV